MGPHVVVFGSASPDYEAIALAFGASHVTTIGACNMHSIDTCVYYGQSKAIFDKYNYYSEI